MPLHWLAAVDPYDKGIALIFFRRYIYDLVIEAAPSDPSFS
jgi:hypothetical protein